MIKKQIRAVFLITVFMLTSMQLHTSVHAEVQQDIPILMYHHLSYAPEEWNEVVISPDKFKQDMMYLKILGYETIYFKDLIAYKEKAIPLPKNPIVITFDDGYMSNYEYAYPILKELEMKATIGVIGWSVGRTTHKDNETPIIPHFTWEQAREMYESGWIDIQHHTFDMHESGLGVQQLTGESHQDYVDRMVDDTIKLKEEIESHVGNEVVVFSYPLGLYNTLSESAIKILGFKVSLTTNKGINSLSDELYLMKRINRSNQLSCPQLMKELLNLQKKQVDIPYIHIQDSGERVKHLYQLLAEIKTGEDQAFNHNDKVINSKKVDCN